MVFNNLGDVPMVAFYSHDEIYLLNTIWYFYSGEFNPETVQGLGDYGLLFRYIVDVAKVLISPFVEVTPGLLWGIVRGLNLLFGLATFWVTWRMAQRHFPDGWAPVVSVLGIGLCPSFVWHLDFAKPEPITLFFTVLALDYVLRIIDDSDPWALHKAIVCAIVAFVVKFVGMFIFPVIVLALSSRWLMRPDRYDAIYWRASWEFSCRISPLIFAAIASGLFGLSIWLVYYRVRFTTGVTLSAEFALWDALFVLMGPVKVVYAVAAGLVVLAAIPLFMFGRQYVESKAGERWIDGMFFYSALIRTAVFSAVAFAVLGFRWLLDPMDLLMKFYGTSASYSIGSRVSFFADPMAYMELVGNNFIDFLYTMSGLRLAFFGWYNNVHVVGESKIVSDLFSPFGLVLLSVYGVIEYLHMRNKGTLHRIDFIKRMQLLSFMCIYSFYVVGTSLYSSLHMNHLLVLIPPGFLLIGQIPNLLRDIGGGHTKCARGLIVFCALLLLATFTLNAQMSWRWRANKLYQRPGSEDVVWQIQQWFRDNLPLDTAIVADLPYRAYVPPEYEKVSYFSIRADAESTVKSVIEKIALRNPCILYINKGRGLEWTFPDPHVFLPDYIVEELAHFPGNSYARIHSVTDDFYIYKIRRKDHQGE